MARYKLMVKLGGGGEEAEDLVPLTMVGQGYEISKNGDLTIYEYRYEERELSRDELSSFKIRGGPTHICGVPRVNLASFAMGTWVRIELEDWTEVEEEKGEEEDGE